VRLIQQEILQRPLRAGKQFRETHGRKIIGQGVDAAKVTAVREPKNAVVQFQGDVNVRTVFLLIGAFKKFFRIREPEKLAVQAEVHGQQAAIQRQKDVLANPPNLPDAPALGESGNVRRALRLRRNRMKNMGATNALPLDERAERSNDGFYFR
jgi:hypothetical protein